MSVFRTLAVIALLAATLGTVQAAQPVIRMSSSCDAPSMPGTGSSKEDWNTYSLLVKDYNDCMAEKAGKYADKTKEALEGVGDTVTGWTDTAKGWFSK